VSLPPTGSVVAAAQIVVEAKSAKKAPVTVRW
jgi:hypothetical protein